MYSGNQVIKRDVKAICAQSGGDIVFAIAVI